MTRGEEVIKLLNETYELEDLNLEDNKKITSLRHQINKHMGMMSLRSKQKNQIMDKIREMVLK